MRDSLITKLKSEIEKGISSESQVVYIMIEIRKLLEKTNQEEVGLYETVKFYCDWLAHTSKKKITKYIREFHVLKKDFPSLFLVLPCK
jgi:hypothetical protein